MVTKSDLIDHDTRRVGGSRSMRLAPVGFWSYARQDDYLSQGKLSELRSLLMFELQQLYGRGEIKIFQDASTIPHGAAWENEVTAALSQSTFFIAIITPNFIQSEWCCREVSLFVEREAELHRLHPDLDRRSRIMPVHYIDVTDVDPADPEVLSLLNSLQWFDFRRLRHRDFEGEQVRQTISELAGGLKDLLNLRVENPETLRAREHAAEEERKRAAVVAQAEQEHRALVAAERARLQEEARVQEAADQAEAERQAEASRKREAAIAQAEAARKAAEEAAEAARKRAEEAEQAAQRQAALAAEAARMVAAEREAAEQARREAAAIAQRLNDAEHAAAAAARLTAERARESAERAQAEQEAAARDQRAAEVLAEQARLESNQAEAHQQALAYQVAQQRLAGGSFVQSGGGQNQKLWIALGAVAALVVLLYLFWPRQDVGNGVAPAIQNGQADQGTNIASTDQRAWLTRRDWGMDGNCAYLLEITIDGDTLRVRYGGETQTLTIQPPVPGESWDDVVRTDRATYTRRGDSVEVREVGAVSEIPYRLTRCAGR
jgi:hypothetical protein